MSDAPAAERSQPTARPAPAASRNPRPFEALPEGVRRQLLAIGPKWASDVRGCRDLVWAAFEPLLASAPRDGVVRVDDLAYGDHPRQRLDVFRPAAIGQGLRPVVVFVHGGAFVRGDSLRGATFVDSPLVRRRSYFAGGLGVAYVFDVSSKTVDVDDR